MPTDSVWKPRDDSKQVEMVPGVRRQVLACGERSMVVRISIAKDAVVPMHSHPNEQIGHIASGKFRFTIGDETRDVSLATGTRFRRTFPTAESPSKTTLSRSTSSLRRATITASRESFFFQGLRPCNPVRTRGRGTPSRPGLAPARVPTPTGRAAGRARTAGRAEC